MVFNLRCYTNFPFHTQLVSSNIYDCTCPAKTHAIFVPNLPMNATVEQLEAVFKNFGPIKYNGIQVRSSKQQGTCFGFVEFESASSMQSAIEKSPIEMLDREVRIEERRGKLKISCHSSLLFKQFYIWFVVRFP
ncbi:hypothetical protein CFP56_030063 [Quercus suber]|uniref:RRM domain-containing protein n=1 Tax=Quercus suber TaxID=58331 RepID=A0AAW0JRH6_QUESU